MEAAKALGGAPVHVTLIDRRNFHLFQPLLYQVATGTLSPADICAPIRRILRDHKNIRTLLGEVSGFDLEGGRVLLTDGEEPFDTLIVAAGARHSYFGNDQWEPIAPGLKTVEDAAAIRRKMFLAFEKAEREPDLEKRRAWLTFVIVGAGPTGVELAGSLGEIANDTLREDFRSFRPEDARILLLDASARILNNFPEDLAAAAERDLLKLGVRCLSNRFLTSIDAEGLEVRTGNSIERIQTRTIIWAAGVRASPLAGKLAEACGVTLDRAGRIPVTPHCSISGYPNVLVLGDMANFAGPDRNPLPGVAPVAMQQGRYAAESIRRALAGEDSDPFVYVDKGNLATIGRHSAIADIRGRHFTGWFAWVIWLFIHLMYLVGFQNRLQVFIRWGFQYLAHARNARLITLERFNPQSNTGP